jgi:hypothetical protein
MVGKAVINITACIDRLAVSRLQVFFFVTDQSKTGQ